MPAYGPIGTIRLARFCHQDIRLQKACPRTNGKKSEAKKRRNFNLPCVYVSVISATDVDGFFVCLGFLTLTCDGIEVIFFSEFTRELFLGFHIEIGRFLSVSLLIIISPRIMGKDDAANCGIVAPFIPNSRCN